MYYLINWESGIIIDKGPSEYSATDPLIQEEDVPNGLYVDQSIMASNEKMDYLIGVRQEHINSRTAEIIEAGFSNEFQGTMYYFRANAEDQRNYIGAVIAKDAMMYSGDYRLRIKCYDESGDVTYFLPEGPEDIETMFGAGVTSILTNLGTGWILKDSLQALTFDDLVGYTDPRG